MPVSHKHLLEKYIDHVTQCGGIDFVIKPSGHSDVEFTSDEVEFFHRTHRMLDEDV